MGKPENISAIIPVYNEEDNVKKVLKKIIKVCNEIIIVNDGSKDQSLRRILDFKSNNKNFNIKIINHEKNRGYIRSIYDGGKKASNEILITIDSDDQHYISDIEKMKKLYNEPNQIIIGVRDKLPRLGETLISKIVGVKDATTGLKLFNKNFLKFLETDNLYGAKAIFLAKENDYEIIELPIQIKDRIKGKTSFNNLIVFYDAIRFFIYTLYYRLIKKSDKK